MQLIVIFLYLHREGAVFGYGLALCATFTESSKDSRVYAIAAYNKLAEFVKNLDLPGKPSLLDEVRHKRCHFQRRSDEKNPLKYIRKEFVKNLMKFVTFQNLWQI